MQMQWFFGRKYSTVLVWQSPTEQLTKVGWRSLCSKVHHLLLKTPTTKIYFTHSIYSMSQQTPAWNFMTFFLQLLGFLIQILHAHYTFLSTLDYIFLFNYLQLWRSYAILSATNIMCSKCPPSTETHTGWLHLIWHNFVIVGDNSTDGGHFAHMMWTGWSRLIWHNFVKVAGIEYKFVA